jgi:hypothetical protein
MILGHANRMGENERRWRAESSRRDGAKAKTVREASLMQNSRRSEAADTAPVRLIDSVLVHSERGMSLIA